MIWLNSWTYYLLFTYFLKKLSLDYAIILVFKFMLHMTSLAWKIIDRFWLVNKLLWVTNCLFFFIYIHGDPVVPIWFVMGLSEQLIFCKQKFRFRFRFRFVLLPLHRQWPIQLDWMMDQSYLIWKKVGGSWRYLNQSKSCVWGWLRFEIKIERFIFIFKSSIINCG